MEGKSSVTREELLLTILMIVAGFVLALCA